MNDIVKQRIYDAGSRLRSIGLEMADGPAEHVRRVMAGSTPVGYHNNQIDYLRLQPGRLLQHNIQTEDVAEAFKGYGGILDLGFY